VHVVDEQDTRGVPPAPRVQHRGQRVEQAGRSVRSPRLHWVGQTLTQAGEVRQQECRAGEVFSSAIKHGGGNGPARGCG